MDESRQRLEELRSALTRRLHVLQLQAATYGISTPPHVQIEIEDTQKQIADLDRQLAGSPNTNAPERISQTKLFRRQQLQQRYDALKQEADTVNRQILSVIDEAQRVVLQRKLNGLFEEMETIENQMP
jgi:hypothetical protein